MSEAEQARLLLPKLEQAGEQGAIVVGAARGAVVESTPEGLAQGAVIRVGEYGGHAGRVECQAKAAATAHGGGLAQEREGRLGQAAEARIVREHELERVRVVEHVL